MNQYGQNVKMEMMRFENRRSVKWDGTGQTWQDSRMIRGMEEQGGRGWSICTCGNVRRD